MSLPLKLGVTTCLLVLCPAKGAGAEDERALYFVVAKHATVWVEGDKQEVLDVERLVEIVEQAAKESMVYCHFRMTEAGAERYEKIQRFFWPLRNKLYHQGRTRGASVSSVSSRASRRWDKIRSQQDCEIDESRALAFKVTDQDGKPVSGAQVVLLPQEQPVGVHVCNGRLRDPLDEHFAMTNESGRFTIQPQVDEKLIAVVHPTGFTIREIDGLTNESALQVESWATIRLGTRHERTEPSFDVDSPLKISSFPLPGMAFYVWETVVEQDGSFVQRYVPPGQVMVQNAFLIRAGETVAIDNTRIQLLPGQEFELTAKIER